MILQQLLSQSLLKCPLLNALWHWIALQVDLLQAEQQVATAVGWWAGPLLAGLKIKHAFNSIKAAIYAAVYGRLVIGFLKGSLGGLVFWFVGLPAPAFWGSRMALLSILPVMSVFLIVVGLLTFGPLGLLLGPAIIAGALSLIAVWKSDLAHISGDRNGKQ